MSGLPAATPSLVHPEWSGWVLAVWLAVVAAVGLARLRARRRRRLLLGDAPTGGRDGARDVLALLALLAIGVALLGPRLGTRSERLPASGVDVVLLLDVSRSMDARDVPPSRLDRARQAADALLSGLAPGDRAALAAFAARGVLVTPLSRDRAALRELLPSLDTRLVRPGSSRLGKGVRRALEAFDPASERPRVLVVLSDGEDADGTADDGRADVLRAGARVVAVATGREAGATIPNQGLELRDRRGQVVVTRRDAARLAALAQATDGELLPSDRFGAVDASRLVAAVRRDAAGASEEGWIERRVPAVRVAPFALLALLLLAHDAAPRLRRPLAAGVAALALVGAAPGPEGEALDRIERGLALAAAERWPEAERAFRAAALAARAADLAADAYFDAGVAALEAGRLEAARDAFFEAAALAPGDLETRFNLEWTLRALAAEPPPPPPTSRPDEAEPGPPDPSPQTPPDPAEPPAPRPTLEIPPLSPEEVEGLLARATDDPGRALRGLRQDDARAEGSPW